MTNEITFEVKGDFQKLHEEFMATDGVETIYIEKQNGELFPVANIERHPDCPKHIYEVWKRSLLLCYNDPDVQGVRENPKLESYRPAVAGVWKNKDE